MTHIIIQPLCAVADDNGAVRAPRDGAFQITRRNGQILIEEGRAELVLDPAVEAPADPGEDTQTGGSGDDTQSGSGDDSESGGA